MSDSDDPIELDESDVELMGPTLESEEDRDSWIETLCEQTEESIGGEWIRAVFVVDENSANMVVRFIFPDGGEEVYDLIVRRVLVRAPDASEAN